MTLAENRLIMQKFFNENGCTKIKEVKEVPRKYDICMMIYEQRVKDYITFYK